MANIESKSSTNPPTKLDKASFIAQIVLRICAVVCTLSGMWLMLSNKESKILFNVAVHAGYTDSSAFIFNVIANAIACGCSVVSLFAVVMLGGRGSSPPDFYFFLFIHDLMMTVLVIAGCAAATAFGFVGRFGNKRAGWTGICGYLGKFCHGVTTSLVFTYLSFFCLLALTVMSASKSRRILV